MHAETQPLYTMHYRAYYDDGSEIDFNVVSPFIGRLQVESTRRAVELHNADIIEIEPVLDEHPLHPLLWQSGNVFGYWDVDERPSKAYETMFLADEALREYKMQQIALNPGNPVLESICAAIFATVIGWLTAVIVPTSWWFVEFIVGYTLASVLYFASLESWRTRKEK